jgi:hypothetical protein
VVFCWPWCEPTAFEGSFPVDEVIFVAILMLGFLAGIPRDIHAPVETKVLAGTPWPNELMFSTQNGL